MTTELSLSVSEPSWRHISQEPSDQMIAYKESDVIHSEPDHNHNHNMPRTCGYVKEETEGEEEDEKDDFDENMYIQNLTRTKRQTTGELFLDMRQTRCPLLLVADYRYEVLKINCPINLLYFLF